MFNLDDQWIYTNQNKHTRIDSFLTEKSNLSRSKIQCWIKNNCICVNNNIINKNFILKENDHITIIKILQQPPSNLIPENIPLEIVYEDNDLAVIHKPKNMVVHPGASNYTGTLANALIWYYKHLSDKNGEFRPGILHRLDKNTSGLIVIAKNNIAHQNLSEQIQSRRMKRTYFALTWKHPKSKEGIINQPIKRDPHSKIKMCVHPDGKHSISHYKILQTFLFASLLEVTLQTGRTHQIRVHLDFINCPVIGDTVYGKGSFNIKELPYPQQAMAHKVQHFFNSQALHAGELSFLQPTSKKPLSFSIHLPDSMNKTIHFLNSMSIKN